MGLGSEQLEKASFHFLWFGESVTAAPCPVGADRCTPSFSSLGGIFPGYVPELTEVEQGLKTDLL